MPKTLFVEVLLDQNLARPLDYSVPEEWVHLTQTGMRVEVPLRTGVAQGTISKLKDHSQWPQVKAIVRLISSQSELSDPLWKLSQWMSRYYCSPLQRVIKLFIPPNVRRQTQERGELFLKLTKTHAESLALCETLRKKAPAQAEVLEEILQTPKGVYATSLKAPRSAAAALVKKGILSSEKVLAGDDLLLEEEFFPTKPKKLNAEQEACLSGICSSMEKNQFSVHLIQGITGSGKTEIYLQAIQEALNQNKSAILLVPEISLTSQTIERFRSRFSQKIAILHHRRSLGERSTAWSMLKDKQAMIAIGARSAIFCPAQNLGLIIVDEEHDGSYKQHEETPCYQARDVAIMRGHLEGCPVILGSATPSIESRYNCEIGKYKLHRLTARATSATLPKLAIVDMKRALEQTGGFSHFSPQLLDAIKLRIEKGEQTLLFLNRRGFHRMQMCKGCNHILKCPHCDLALTFHKQADHLRCHLCDFKREIGRECPECRGNSTLEFKGFGTEHVERSLHAVFPEVRTLRMDRDTTKQKNSHEELFKQFRAHKADVLIGTQMIAKGFHFPSVTLVGILNADATLTIPDFRAPEQLFQLITQVAGRSGRSELPGEVILQTFLPEHPTLHLAASQDYEAFFSSQIQERREFGYPPFCHLIKLLFSSTNPQEALSAAEKAHAHILKEGLPPGAHLLPVSPAGHPKIKDFYRFQFVIKCLKIRELHTSLGGVDAPRGVSVNIDVDPVSIFF